MKDVSSPLTAVDGAQLEELFCVWQIQDTWSCVCCIFLWRMVKCECLALCYLVSAIFFDTKQGKCAGTELLKKKKISNPGYKLLTCWWLMSHLVTLKRKPAVELWRDLTVKKRRATAKERETLKSWKFASMLVAGRTSTNVLKRRSLSLLISKVTFHLVLRYVYQVEIHWRARKK